jgi:hypothetical protein
MKMKKSNSISRHKKNLIQNTFVSNYFYSESRIGYIHHVQYARDSNTICIKTNLEQDPSVLISKSKPLNTFFFHVQILIQFVMRYPVYKHIVGIVYTNIFLFVNSKISEVLDITNFRIVSEYIIKTKRFP